MQSSSAMANNYENVLDIFGNHQNLTQSAPPLPTQSHEPLNNQEAATDPTSSLLELSDEAFNDLPPLSPEGKAILHKYRLALLNEQAVESSNTSMPPPIYNTQPQQMYTAGNIPPQSQPPLDTWEATTAYNSGRDMLMQNLNHQNTFSQPSTPIPLSTISQSYNGGQDMLMQSFNQQDNFMQPWSQITPPTSTMGWQLENLYHHPQPQFAHTLPPMPPQPALSTDFWDLGNAHPTQNVAQTAPPPPPPPPMPMGQYPLPPLPTAAATAAAAAPRVPRPRASAAPRPLQQCGQCAYSNRNREEFRRHVDSVHHGIRRHHCPICDKYMNDPSSLSKHKKSAKHRQNAKAQGVEIPRNPGYKCRFCAAAGVRKVFVRSDQLRRHLDKGEGCKHCVKKEDGLPVGYSAGEGGMELGKMTRERDADFVED